MATPVVLVHGWGGSFASTWVSSGFTHLIGDAAEGCEVNQPRISGGTGDDHARSVGAGEVADLVVVDALGDRIDPVAYYVHYLDEWLNLFV